jgi:hypothetical protein
MRNTQRITFSLSLVALTLAACSGDAIVAPANRGVAPSDVTASSSVARPWKGVCDVDAVFTSQTTLLITGTCQLAHLGRTTVTAYQTIEPGASGIAYTNTATYTAANGDQLRTTNVGVATPTAAGLSLTGTETAVGGTGRFTNASGTAHLEGAVAFTGPSSTTGSYELSGLLEY